MSANVWRAKFREEWGLFRVRTAIFHQDTVGSKFQGATRGPVPVGAHNSEYRVCAAHLTPPSARTIS